MAGTVFIKLGAVGDMVQCLPTLQALKLAHPEEPLICVTMKWSASLLEGAVGMDEVIPAPGPGEGGMWKAAAWIRIVAHIRSRRPRVVIVAHRNSWAGRLAQAMGARLRIGFDYQGSGRGWTHSVPYREEAHEVDRYADLAEPLGVSVVNRQPVLKWAGGIRNEEGLPWSKSPGSRWLALHVGGGKNPGTTMEIKRWGVEGWMEVARRVVKNPAWRVVLVGGRDDRDAAGRVASALKQDQVFDVTATEVSLRGLAGVLGWCDAYAGGDSGPLHMAAALGLPTVGVFGPTNPAQWAPRGSRHRVVWHQVECAPCYTPRTVWEGVDFSRCPVGTHICMKGLEVEKVWTSVKEMIKESEKSE